MKPDIDGPPWLTYSAKGTRQIELAWHGEGFEDRDTYKAQS